MDTWICNNDEHVNSETAVACEICGASPPVLHSFRYELTNVFGMIRIYWDADNADKVVLRRKKTEIKLPAAKEMQELEGLKDNEEITLCLISKAASYYKGLKVRLEKPEIPVFKADKERVLEGARFRLSWDTQNATAVSITGMGRVALSGTMERKAAKGSCTIIAVNDVGETELHLELEVLPAPEITAFKAKRGKLAWGEETQLTWEVANARKVTLCHNGIAEAIESSGEKTIHPLEHTTYKLLVTAMDDVTVLEQEVTVQVFKKVEIRDFDSDMKFVVEGLPIKLTWDVAHADQIIIEDNFGTRTDVTAEAVLGVIARKGTKYFKLIASDPLHNVLERKIEVSVKELPTPVIHLPQIKLPEFDLSFGDKVLEQTSFDHAFREAKKIHKPSVSLKSLVHFIYDRS